MSSMKRKFSYNILQFQSNKGLIKVIKDIKHETIVVSAAFSKEEGFKSKSAYNI